MTRILLVGCGKMGQALLEGWLDCGVAPQDIVVVDPQAHAKAPGLRVFPSAAGLPGLRPEVVVLAVKPQMMDEVLPAYTGYRQAVFLSIAAGKPLAYFARHLGADTAVVRAMPNTPAAIRRGMTVAVGNGAVDPSQRDLCRELLAAVGEVAWIDDESLMDAVTAVSGSGPAYVFLLTEALVAAGAAAGLPPGLAARLARATVVGAGELLHQSAETPTVLRENVTSPGGTTFAAMKVLLGDEGMHALLSRAVAAAAQRSRELAG